MTLLLHEGFDSTNAIGQLVSGANGTPAISVGSGRFGSGNTLQCSDSADLVWWNLSGASASGVLGAAFWWGATDGTLILGMYRNGLGPQLTVVGNADGKPRVMRGATVLATSAIALAAGVWCFIELRAAIGASGSFELRINGQVAASASGVNTQNQASGNFDQVAVGGGTTGITKRWDDLYVCDLAGATNNDFLGDVRSLALLPSGAGAQAQWTPSAGSNYAAVDENPPNDDTDYVSSATVGQIDSHAYGNLPATAGVVKGVTHKLRLRKDDAGTRTVAPVARIGGSNYQIGSGVDAPASYTTQRVLQETSPATSTAWTVAEVNAAEFGYTLVA